MLRVKVIWRSVHKIGLFTHFLVLCHAFFLFSFCINFCLRKSFIINAKHNCAKYILHSLFNIKKHIVIV